MKMRLLLALMLFMLSIGCAGSSSPAIPEEGIVTIPIIQGCSHISPYEGMRVSDVVGIVTAKSYNGFYLQTKIPDNLDCSSEGIFIFTDGFPEVIPGDEVQVSGMVDEFRPGQVEDRNLTITEIIDPQIITLSRVNQLPDPVVIGTGEREIPTQIIDNDRLLLFDPGEDGLDFYESLESMLVHVPQGVVVGPRNPFNEVTIIPPEYLVDGNISTLGALVQKEDDANPERILVNLNSENKGKVNLGSQLIRGITGVMDYSYGNYKIRAFGLVNIKNQEPVPPEFIKDDDLITLATYNVENLSRQDENARFRGIAAHIVEDLANPDIILIHEVMDDSGVEDDGTVTANQTVNRLVSAIEQEGGPRYSSAGIDPVNNGNGGIPGGNIRSLFLFNEDAGVTLVNEKTESVLDMNPLTIGTADWPFSVTRKPLIALFKWNNTQFLVVGVHLTSRGLDSPLFGSVQPIERLEEDKRVSQAIFVNKFLEGFHRNHPEIPVIIAGDINDDPWSETMAALQGKILYDAGSLIDENERYSYILDGNAVQLDHVLVSDPSLVKKYQIPHLNSIFDHSLQVSDHDPVLIELDFSAADNY